MYQQVAEATHTGGKGRGSTTGVPRALPLLQVLIQQPPQGAHTFRIYKKTGQEQASMGDGMEISWASSMITTLYFSSRKS